MKRTGLIKAASDIVRRPEDARFFLDVSIPYHGLGRRRTICKAELTTAVAFAMA